MLTISPLVCSLDLDFVIHSPRSFLILLGEGEGPYFLRHLPYEFLQVSAGNLNFNNSPPFCFLPHFLLSPHLLPPQSSWRRRSSPGLPVPGPFSLRKGINFIIISKVFCMSATVESHVSVMSSREKLPSLYGILVSNGIQRIVFEREKRY